MPSQRDWYRLIFLSYNGPQALAMLKLVRIDKTFPEMAKLSALDREAFPPEEYISPEELIKMAEGDNFDFWGLFDEERFVGFMAVMLYQDLCYLFFLAIAKELRGQGYGAQALALLLTRYPHKHQVVDMEQLEPGASNESQREIRRAFYLRNGYRPTGYGLTYLGVDYEILCVGPSFDFEAFQGLMKQIRISGFKPRYYEERR